MSTFPPENKGINFREITFVYYIFTPFLHLFGKRRKYIESVFLFVSLLKKEMVLE